MQSIKHNKYRISRIVAIGLFSALSYAACTVFHFKALFLTFDLKDAFITTGAMIFGPSVGMITSFITALIEGVTISTTGIWGFLMNFLSSAAFAVTASAVYARRRTMTRAVISMGTSVVVTVAVMLMLNLLITPLYTGTSVSEVAVMIPTLLLPFNLTKAVTNAAAVFILYGPISTAVYSSGLIAHHDDSSSNHRKNPKLYVVILISAAIVAAAALVYFFVFLNGSFDIL